MTDSRKSYYRNVHNIQNVIITQDTKILHLTSLVTKLGCPDRILVFFLGFDCYVDLENLKVKTWGFIIAMNFVN